MPFFCVCGHLYVLNGLGVLFGGNLLKKNRNVFLRVCPFVCFERIESTIWRGNMLIKKIHVSVCGHYQVHHLCVLRELIVEIGGKPC